MTYNILVDAGGYEGAYIPGEIVDGKWRDHEFVTEAEAIEWAKAEYPKSYWWVIVKSFTWTPQG